MLKEGYSLYGQYAFKINLRLAFKADPCALKILLTKIYKVFRTRWQASKCHVGLDGDFRAMFKKSGLGKFVFGFGSNALHQELKSRPANTNRQQ